MYRGGVNRREFLQWSGAGAAAALVPACAPAAPAALGPTATDPATGTPTELRTGGISSEPQPPIDAGVVGTGDPLVDPIDAPTPITVAAPTPGAIIGAPTPSDDPPLLGELRMFAGDYAPRGWLPCDGRLLRIAEHTALFALLGVRYGGLGVETFAIPDLRGRVTVGADAEYAPGATGGRDQLITIGVRSGTARTIGSPGSNHQPELALTYLIAIAGVVPAMA